jgi:nucleoside-diphosphate-sugar epimerase
MRLLITGITGFVGSHMAEHALAQAASFVASHRFLVLGTSEEYGLVDPEEIPGGGLTLEHGQPPELYGFRDFDAGRILAQKDMYYVGRGWPVMVQTLVLAKPR